MNGPGWALAVSSLWAENLFWLSGSLWLFTAWACFSVLEVFVLITDLGIRKSRKVQQGCLECLDASEVIKIDQHGHPNVLVKVLDLLSYIAQGLNLSSNLSLGSLHSQNHLPIQIFLKGFKLIKISSHPIMRLLLLPRSRWYFGFPENVSKTKQKLPRDKILSTILLLLGEAQSTFE